MSKNSKDYRIGYARGHIEGQTKEIIRFLNNPYLRRVTNNYEEIIKTFSEPEDLVARAMDYIDIKPEEWSLPPDENWVERMMIIIEEIKVLLEKEEDRENDLGPVK